MAAYQKKQQGTMTEGEKKALIAKKIEEKKAELAAGMTEEEKKALIAKRLEDIKVKIRAAAAKGDKAEVERLIALAKGGNK